MPDYNTFHESITAELYSIKDRIRSLVSHWPTDGEHKERALRSVLRRHLPASVTVGQGFVVSPDRASTQVDILVVDSAKPVLFREGDLLIVTPDAVRAAIEVKSAPNSRADLCAALAKLARVEMVCSEFTGLDSVWTGLFTFNESSLAHTGLLGAIADAFGETERPVNCVSYGKNSFVRFWPRGAAVNSRESGPVWHSYNLPGIAPSYFIGNLIDAISSLEAVSARFAWFPALGGKEIHRRYFLPQGARKARSF